MNLWWGGEHRIFINKRDRPVRSHFNLGGFDDGLCPVFDHWFSYYCDWEMGDDVVTEISKKQP